MSSNVILIIAGAVLFLAGLAKMGSSQSGGFSLRNIGIGIGSTITQTTKLEEAVAAYRAALEELKPESAPHWHSVAQLNLTKCLDLLQRRRIA